MRTGTESIKKPSPPLWKKIIKISKKYAGITLRLYTFSGFRSRGRKGQRPEYLPTSLLSKKKQPKRKLLYANERQYRTNIKYPAILLIGLPKTWNIDKIKSVQIIELLFKSITKSASY